MKYRVIGQGLWWRTIGLVSVAMIVVSGVTFAALQSQNAMLAGSTITSATANLQIGDGQGNYGATAPGFAFTNIEPGGPAAPAEGKIVTLRNAGTSKLAIKVAMDSWHLANPQSIAMAKVFLVVTPVAGGTPQEISLMSLITGFNNNTPIALDGPLDGGQDGQYKLQIRMAGDLVSSTLSSISLAGVDLVFSGTSVSA